ncbi:MAG: mannonate dehydratase [Cytophagaceae bacterium BCCC1]|nr:MAG: mannonate dehydratase [Cytophagaceae bacterium BCCC1]
MKSRLLPIFLTLFYGINFQLFAQQSLPNLLKKGTTTQLIVDDKPFIVLGGELGNSTATTIENMKSVWPKLKTMNLNTVLVPVYWELIEPKESKFDFKLYQDLILEARQNDIKLVFLWFGSWKNSMSSHAPAWVKLNQDKYPRVKDQTGRSQEILSSFSENVLQADKNAFEKLMQFIKDFDNKARTVIMVQIENEIGMLPSARDHQTLANEAFKKPVPAELMTYLQQNKDNLVPEFREIWKKNGYKTSGNWEEVFGNGLHTDEIFMAYYYADFTDKITEAGKKIYPLPMFVNAALNKAGREPGNYPSAGPLPHLMDVWKSAGKAVDFLSPDFYNPDFKHWCDLYTRQGDVLFVPEHVFDQTVAAKALYTIGHYEGMGFSPFSIESTQKPEDEPIGKMYGLIKELSPLITSNQGTGKIKGVMLSKSDPETIVRLGKYEFTCKHDYTLTWTSGARTETWPLGSAIIIQTAENEFYIAGSGVVITTKSIENKDLNIGLLKVDEGNFVNNQWTVKRHLNGDQTHQGRHINIATNQFGIQRVEFYGYR